MNAQIRMNDIIQEFLERATTEYYNSLGVPEGGWVMENLWKSYLWPTNHNLWIDEEPYEPDADGPVEWDEPALPEPEPEEEEEEEEEETWRCEECGRDDMKEADIGRHFVEGGCCCKGCLFWIEKYEAEEETDSEDDESE